MRFAKAEASESNANIAPLLDVVLLLLIFFMVTTSFAERQIPLDLPDSESGASQASEPLVVSIDAQGVFSVERDAISLEDLGSLFRTASRENRPLELRADEATRHGVVVQILDLAKQADLDQIGIAVQPGK